jgi:hypothetical protein
VRLPTFKKKFVAGALAAGLMAGAGGIAVAYYSSTASGTGTVHANVKGTFAVTNVKIAHTLTPGTSNVTLYADIQNTSATGNVSVRTIVVVITGTSKSTCPVTYFTFGGSTPWTGATGGSGTHGPATRTLKAPVKIAAGDYYNGSTSSGTTPTGFETASTSANALYGLKLNMKTTGTQNTCSGVTVTLKVTVDS